MQKKLGRNTVVLLGIGHTNAHVLRMWKMQPLANAQLVCISDFPVATYSGMLPGVLAGQYPVDDMEIDLVRLCQSAGARLILDRVTGLDLQRHRIEFENRPGLDYEVLSIGVGSRPTFAGVEVEDASLLVPVKPMQTFLDRLEKRLDESSCRSATQQTESSPARTRRIAIVGGGVGSIEIAFCLDKRLRERSRSPDDKLKLITGSSEVGSGLAESTRHRVQTQLKKRQIEVLTGQRVKRINSHGLKLANDDFIEADAVIWATNAVGQPVLSTLGSPLDEKGFLKTNAALQVQGQSRIFAVGDSGTIAGQDVPKAGVFAVRQGPVLWDNVQRVIWKRPVQDYDPQRRFLKLINTADGKSIAEYGSWSGYSSWWWRLKDRIDSNFMAKYQDYEPMPMTASESDPSEPEMRCLGCGGKIGSQLLSEALSELDVPSHEDVEIGLDQPDDAAVIRTHNNQVTVTTDFFASPLDDPYLAGRIALLNSASDCFVMGAQPTAALAMVQIPVGHPRAQLQVMRELMAGSVKELRNMNATLAGGHSIEGPRTTIGFTVLGRQLADPKTKGMLQPGDLLICSKPLGTGVALAALMQSRLKAEYFQPLIEMMLASNQIALRLIREASVSAITDITGFGLVGHLAEMLNASQVSARITMSDIPLLPGCQALLNGGVESTLADDNRGVAKKIDLQMEDVNAAAYASLFDPQTSGGLLIGVAEEKSTKVLSLLHDAGFAMARVIGNVSDRLSDRSEVVIQHYSAEAVNDR